MVQTKSQIESLPSNEGIPLSVPSFLANELETIRAKIHSGGFGNPERAEKNYAAALVANCIVEIRSEEV